MCVFFKTYVIFNNCAAKIATHCRHYTIIYNRTSDRVWGQIISIYIFNISIQVVLSSWPLHYQLLNKCDYLMFMALNIPIIDISRVQPR